VYARNSNAITIGNKLRANLLKNEQLLPDDPSNCRFAISRLDNETLSTFLYNRYANCGVDTILCQSHVKSSRTKKPLVRRSAHRHRHKPRRAALHFLWFFSERAGRTAQRVAQGFSEKANLGLRFIYLGYRFGTGCRLVRP